MKTRKDDKQDEDETLATFTAFRFLSLSSACVLAQQEEKERTCTIGSKEEEEKAK